MGYPMTFQRLVNRNRMQGDYGTRMSLVNTKPYDRQTLKGFNPDVDHIDVLLRHAADLGKEIDALDGRWGLVLGDLRRLEQDAADEGAICKHIAARTGIDADIVAVVLKEFISW